MHHDLKGKGVLQFLMARHLQLDEQGKIVNGFKKDSLLDLLQKNPDYGLDPADETYFPVPNWQPLKNGVVYPEGGRAEVQEQTSSNNFDASTTTTSTSSPEFARRAAAAALAAARKQAAVVPSAAARKQPTAVASLSNGCGGRGGGGGTPSTNQGPRKAVMGKKEQEHTAAAALASLSSEEVQEKSKREGEEKKQKKQAYLHKAWILFEQEVCNIRDRPPLDDPDIPLICNKILQNVQQVGR